MQAASCTYRIAYGPRAGQKLLTVRGASPTTGKRKHKSLCVDQDGFSLHAAVSCEAHERSKLEKLCRYITRPALANERITINDKGQVVLKLKSAWNDGTTHLVLWPQEFMQRLAALVLRPRLHLTRYHGVLAPNAKWRSLIVPEGPLDEPVAQAQDDGAQAQEGKPLSAKRYGWAKLLKRVFGIDMEHCPHCGGKLRIIAAILERAVINKIFRHLAEQEKTRAHSQNAIGEARAPPLSQATQCLQKGQWLVWSRALARYGPSLGCSAPAKTLR